MVEALISAASSLLGIVLTSLITNSLVKYRVQELEKKVDKHNQVIERIYKIEEKVENIGTSLERIKDKLEM